MDTGVVVKLLYPRNHRTYLNIGIVQNSVYGEGVELLGVLPTRAYHFTSATAWNVKISLYQ